MASQSVLLPWELITCRRREIENCVAANTLACQRKN